MTDSVPRAPAAGTTLLAIETAGVQQEFDDRWAAWLNQEEWKPPEAGTRLSCDHFPFLLYEFFDTVPISAARRIALAATASSKACRLRHSDAWLEPGDGVHLKRACAWLTALAWQELTVIVPPEAPLWQSITGDGFDERLAIDPRTTAAAFGAVAACPPDIVERVTRSQSHFYSAAEVFEDCLSWRTDYSRGHLTPVGARLAIKLDEVAPGPSGAGVDIDTAARHFYYSGLAERILEEAMENVCLALAAVADLASTSWVALLAGYLDQITALRGDITRIRRSQLTDLRQRCAPKPETSALRAPDPPPADADIVEAVDAAVGFLHASRDQTGSWSDFLLLGTPSTFWVTGYVGWNLLTSGQGDAAVDEAAGWLMSRELSGGGWAYNAAWPVDNDSTAHALLFLSRMPYIAAVERSGALERLLASQHPGGGFSTILDAEEWLHRFRSGIADVRGWMSPHPCVTAVVALLLAELGGSRELDRASHALADLQQRQQPGGYWNAYWWRGGLYTTCRVIQAFDALRRRGREISGADSTLSRAGRWLVQSQGRSGGWSAGPDEPSAAFHTALAVQALHALGTGERTVDRAATAGMRWLHEHQRGDGSWDATPMLRVPRPDCLRPWDQALWTESIVGLNVVVPDWRRVFTTATAVRALSC